MIKQISIKTRFGWISAFEEKGRIVKIKFGKTRKKSISSNLRKFKNSLNNFITGKSKSIKSNLLIKGNPIQKKVWKELTRIKLGQTKSYNEIAKKYKISPRYVGKICGQNKLLLLVPCHRVIKSDGSIGGFSSIGGIKLKKKLLEFEKL